MWYKEPHSPSIPVGTADTFTSLNAKNGAVPFLHTRLSALGYLHPLVKYCHVEQTFACSVQVFTKCPNGEGF